MPTTDDDGLLARLMADPMTARLLAAWRTSTVNFEAARQVAIDAGHEDQGRGMDMVARRDDP